MSFIREDDDPLQVVLCLLAVILVLYLFFR